MIRSREIYIDPDTHQLLKWLVAAHNIGQEPNSSLKMTVDELTNTVLLQWLKTTHPKLVALLERRQSLDREAMEIVLRPSLSAH